MVTREIEFHFSCRGRDSLFPYAHCSQRVLIDGVDADDDDESAEAVAPPPPAAPSEEPLPLAALADGQRHAFDAWAKKFSVATTALGKISAAPIPKAEPIAQSRSYKL